MPTPGVLGPRLTRLSRIARATLLALSQACSQKPLLLTVTKMKRKRIHWYDSRAAVVRGRGREGQGHSALVKEAVYNNLMGCGAPFRLVPDHSRSGRLEASTLALCKWLVSIHFTHYLHVMQVPAAPL